jgi:DNA-binding NarL/FixJ family response regulator
MRGTRLKGRAIFVTVLPLFADIIVKVVCEELDLELIAQFDDHDALAEQLPALAPDLVVIGLRPGEADQIGAFALGLVPAAKVLVLSDDGRYACCYETKKGRTVLQDFSPDGLLGHLTHTGQRPPPSCS